MQLYVRSDTCLKQLKEIQRSVVGIHEVYGELYQQLGFTDILGVAKRQQTKTTTDLYSCPVP